MTTPQQPEIRRSGRTPVDQDSERTKSEVQAQAPQGGGTVAPVPEANEPGHHPEVEQDKPEGAPGGA